MTISDYNAAVDAHADGIYRFALKHLRDTDRAKDVVQESFARLWMKVDQVDAAKVKSYLFTTAHHALVDDVRKGARSTRLEDHHDRLQHTQQDQPDLMFINFGYTDHAGHIAKDILEYQEAIRNCDEQFWKLWSAIQADPYYRDTTTVFFVNDHGRHSEDFHSHGDHCDGCEHIMLLALGPDIKKGFVSDQEALQIDIAPTIGELLGVQTPLAKGRVLTECMTQNLGVNKFEAVTDAGRKAVEMEKLADRDLVQQLLAARSSGDDLAASLAALESVVVSGDLPSPAMLAAVPTPAWVHAVDLERYARGSSTVGGTGNGALRCISSRTCG